MGTQSLSAKEQELLVLCIVSECIEYSKVNNKSFEDVLHEDVFANNASTDFSEFICKTIETLNSKGYIDGIVELEYEIEIDQDSMEESSTAAIDFAMCTFEDISISLKGKAYMGIDNLKTVSKDFMEKSKPIIKCIGETILQTMVENTVSTIMKSVGFVF